MDGNLELDDKSMIFETTHGKFLYERPCRTHDQYHKLFKNNKKYNGLKPATTKETIQVINDLQEHRIDATEKINEMLPSYFYGSERALFLPTKSDEQYSGVIIYNPFELGELSKEELIQEVNEQNPSVSFVPYKEIPTTHQRKNVHLKNHLLEAIIEEDGIQTLEKIMNRMDAIYGKIILPERVDYATEKTIALSFADIEGMTSYINCSWDKNQEPVSMLWNIQ